MSGGYWGAIAQGATDIGQAFVNDRTRRKSQRFAESVMANKYQWAARDLEKAGLNRILAITQPQASVAGNYGIAYNPKGGYGQAALASTLAKKENKLLDESARKIRAEATSAEHDATIRGQQAAASYELPGQARALSMRMENEGWTAANKREFSRLENEMIASELEKIKYSLPEAKALADWYQTDAGRALKAWEAGASDALEPLSGLFKMILLKSATKSFTTNQSTSHNVNENINVNRRR